MKYNMLQEAAKINKDHRRKSLWRRIVSILAAIVVFTTTYALILPALTLETDVAEENGVFIESTIGETEEAAVETEAESASTSPEEPEEPEPTEPEAAAEDEITQPETIQEGGKLLKAANMPAQSFEAEVDGVKVNAKANKGALPARTTMEVMAVEDAEIISAVKKTVKDEIKQLKIVDITFKNAKGEIIEPAAKVRIKLTSDVIKNGKAPMVVHIDNSGKSSIVNQLTEKQLGTKPAADEIYFDSDEFSAYAIVETYTVDFHYMDFDFSIEGDGRIYLSELFTALGVAERVSDVESVEFSNPSLIRIEQKKSDWLLTSLKPFNTEEVLTVTMKDGTVYVIDVKDPPSYSMTLVTGVSSYLDSIMLHMIDGLTEDNFRVDNVVINNNTENKLFFDHNTLAIRADSTIASSENVSLDITYTMLDSNHNPVLDEENNPVTETVHVAVHSENPPEGEVTWYVETSIMHGQHYEDPALNDWQAVAERYAGNTPGNKIVSQDKYVRIQKNVIPLGIENEFLVYLGVDVSEGAVLERIVSGIGTVYTPSNPMPNYGDVWGSNNASKADQAMETGKSGNMRGFTLEPTPTCNKKWTLRFNLPTGEVVTATRWAEFDSFNNGHLVMKISGNPQPHGTWITVGRAAKAVGTGPDGSYIADITLDAKAIEMILSYYGAEVDLGAVIDQMGGQSIEVIETHAYTELDGASVTPGSYVVVDGEETDTISSLNWDVGTLRLFGATHDGYYTNVAELLYKVTLDVTADGFQSGQVYDVNQNATLAYRHSDETTGSIDFPKPKIKGTTYNFEFTKKDQNGQIMPGIEFNVAISGNPDVTSLPQSITKVVSGPDGKVSFHDLPWGTYTLTEKIPGGYMDVGPWILNIGYTTDLGDGTITEHTGSSTTPSVFPAVYIGNPLKPVDDGHGGYNYVLEDCWTGTGTARTLINRRNIITVKKTIDTFRDLTKDQVDHIIFIALRLHDQKDENGNDIYLTDEQGNIIYKRIDINAGSITPNNGNNELGIVTFGEFENIPSGLYDVMELRSVAGDTPVRLNIGDRITNHTGTVIQVHDISATCYNTGENGEQIVESSNDADLRYSNESEVDFQNTYSYETDMNFLARKRWMSLGREIDPPAGSTVEFTVYRFIEGVPISEQTPHVVGSVTLDGVPDEGLEIEGTGEYAAWRARFANLPLYDVDGVEKYQYYFRETDCPADFKPYENELATTPMGPNDYESNGGTIWNKQETISITIKKEDDKGNFLPGSKFKLYKVVEGSPDEWIGAEIEIDSEDGVTIENIVTGSYKLVETKAPSGYIILVDSIEFDVDLIGTGNAVNWPGGVKPAIVKDLTTTNYNNDTITVINTPGEELPMTGGNGKTIYTLGGLALMGSALVYGFGLRRRRERRFNE